jgi:hypothetical protein
VLRFGISANHLDLLVSRKKNDSSVYFEQATCQQ